MKIVMTLLVRDEEEIVDEFKRFLDDVSPDQFAVGEEENS